MEFQERPVSAAVAACFLSIEGGNEVLFAEIESSRLDVSVVVRRRNEFERSTAQEVRHRCVTYVRIPLEELPRHKPQEVQKSANREEVIREALQVSADFGR
jgi:hypothetical protein